MPIARSRFAALVAAIAALVVVLGLGASPASADGPGTSISGRVTDALGSPVVGATVNASGGVDFPTTVTDANGDYTLPGLSAGTSYRVSFVAPVGTDLVNQYYAGASSYADATPVVLGADEARTGVDAVLAQGGSVSGTVTKADGSAAAGATIFVIPPGSLGDVAVGRASDDGTYVVHGVPAGSYQVKFEGSDLENVPALWYPGSPSRDDAATIAVTAGATTAGIDVVRPPETVPDPTGFVGGVVRDAVGNGVDGATVTATGAAGVFTTTTFFGGNYSLSVPVGSYVVGASSAGLVGYHPAAATPEAATPVDVSAGSFLFGTDIALQPVAPPVQVPRISGRITGSDGAPLAFASVQAMPIGPSGGAWGSAWTDADGLYTINDLAPGSYKVQARGPFGSSYVPLYYPNATSSWEGTALTIGADTHLTGIDLALPVGGTITGTITVPVGQSLSAVNVYASTDTGAGSASATVDPTTGVYTLTGLIAGSYRVQASAWGTNLVTGYFPGATTYDGATLVPATAGGTTTGIDFDLVAGASVSGVVAGPDGPLANASVQVSLVGAFGGSYATTDDTGHYAVVGLREGSYTVRFGAPWGLGLVGNYFPGVYTEAAATVLTLPAGGSATADGTLVRSALVSGRVTDPDGNPITEAFVTLVDPSGAQYGFAGTDVGPDGHYSLTGEVPPGTFTVQVTPYNNSPFPSAYYPGVPTLEKATFLTVAAGDSKSDVDVRLARGAELKLTLSAPGRTPARGVQVELVDPSGATEAPGGRTDESGVLDLRGLAAGSKRIAIARASGDTPYVAQYFAAPHGTKVKESQGTLVALKAGATTTLSATLQTGAKITGVIRQADGTPLGGRMVVAFVDTPAGAKSAGTPLATRSATTAPDGSYTIQGLLPGSYLVAVPTWPGGDVFYGTGATHGAPNVKVVGTKTTKNIDIAIGTTFTDVQPTSPFATDIEWIAAAGFLPGVTAPDGSSTFGSSSTVTRAELAGVLYRAAGSPALKASKTPAFTDVPRTDPQFAAIAWAYSQGYLTGWTERGKSVFRPGAAAVRAEAARALYRFAGSPSVTLPRHAAFADVGRCTPEYKAITWLASLGVTSGGSRAGHPVFRPSAGLTRGALAEALHKTVTAHR